MKARFRSLQLAALFLLFVTPVWAQKPYSSLSSAEKKLYNEHILKGQPDGSTAVLVRHAYVAHYNPDYRIPDWVAYHAVPEYLKTPPREGKFKVFRTDPEVENPVKDADYIGAKYARGHLAPYFIMGGHRGEGQVTEAFDEDSEYDRQTVFQANFLSNIAPQHQIGLNGPGGAWYALETAIRNKLLKKNKMEVYVVVGSIVLDPDNYSTVKSAKTGETNIAIPDEFFQVIIVYDKSKKEYITAGFIFPHVKKKPDKALLDYLVPVDEVESRTGLNFLNQLSAADQNKTESKDNSEYWEKKFE
jgi:endonuclease G